MLEDIIYINKMVFPKAINKLKNNYNSLFIVISYSIINMFLINIGKSVPIIGGLIIALGQSSIISNFLYIIKNIVFYNKFDINTFKYGFKVYLFKVYIVLFLLWFIGYTIDVFMLPIMGAIIIFVKIFISIVIFLILNPLPEIIYQKNEEALESIKYSFDFIKRNVIQWFLPNLVFVGILLYLFKLSVIDMNIIRGLNLTNIILFLSSQILILFAFIYRGLLFKLLDNSSMKKRKFQRNMF